MRPGYFFANSKGHLLKQTDRHSILWRGAARHIKGGGIAKYREKAD